MRKVVSGLFITVDGVTEEPSDWQETFDEDMAADLTANLAQADAVLLGRKTYEYWSNYWPTATRDEGFASFINDAPKYVVSTTLKDVAWGSFSNIKLIQNNLSEELNQLKQQPGKDIAVMGSPTLVNSLLQLGLLDELRLIVHNVVAYRGARLFEAGSLKRLTLVDAKPTRTGVIIATYQPR
jgi:dihydrofolate reductase